MLLAQVEQPVQDNTLYYYIVFAAMVVLCFTVALVLNRHRQKSRHQKQLDKMFKLLARQKEQHLLDSITFKTSQLSSHTTSLIEKNRVLSQIQEEINLLSQSFIGSDEKNKFSRTKRLINYAFNLQKDWEQFQEYFEKVYDDFFSNLTERYPSLNAYEMRLCALIKLNLTIDETAAILGISQESVKMARNRLRRKLQVHNDDGLVNTIMKV